MTWAELSRFEQVMAIVSGVLAIGTFIWVAGYGRLWNRKTDALASKKGN